MSQPVRTVPPMDADLARFESILASQRGLVTLYQLRLGELSDVRTRSLVARKILRRVRPRVYGLVGSPDSWERGLLAVVLSVGAVASHGAAARLWNFVPRPDDRYEISVDRKRRLRIYGVGVHRSGTIGEHNVVVRDGVACTSFERTLCDCTMRLSPYQLGRALDEGLRRGVASLERLKGCQERTESGPGRHMSIVRSLLESRGVGFDPGGSRSELNVLEVLRRSGLPLPVQQYRVKIGSKTYRPDFAWPDRKVFAEYYGLPFHIGAAAVVADNERLTALSAAGWCPLVFTNQSTDREVIERTTEALNRHRDGSETGA